MALNKQHLQLSVFDRLDQEVAFGIIGGTVADVEVVQRVVLATDWHSEEQGCNQVKGGSEMLSAELCCQPVKVWVLKS